MRKNTSKIGIIQLGGKNKFRSKTRAAGHFTICLIFFIKKVG
jgi:hypothetical protein